MRKSVLTTQDTAVLIERLGELELKLKKKQEELRRTRTRLNAAKGKLVKLKETVAFQRQRIIELY
jgi:hypothetical protein